MQTDWLTLYHSLVTYVYCCLMIYTKVRCLSLLSNIMHKYIELPLPCEIVHVNDTTEHFLRSANDFASIGCLLLIRQSSFVFASLSFWKELPNDIRCMVRLKQFTVACKNMYLATSFLLFLWIHFLKLDIYVFSMRLFSINQSINQLLCYESLSFWRALQMQLSYPTLLYWLVLYRGYLLVQKRSIYTI
jgi:hypothetical protein